MTSCNIKGVLNPTGALYRGSDLRNKIALPLAMISVSSSNYNHFQDD